MNTSPQSTHSQSGLQRRPEQSRTPDQFLLTFEQVLVDARQAELEASHQAKLTAQAARVAARAQEEMEKSARRLARDYAYRQRQPDEHAQCGIRWYCRSPRDRDRGCYWTHCHACGQPLIYTSDPHAQPQECKPRK
jgi:hypothetical protein